MRLAIGTTRTRNRFGITSACTCCGTTPGVCVPRPMRAFLEFRRGLASVLEFVLPVCLAILLNSSLSSAQSSPEYAGGSSTATPTAPSQTKSDPTTPMVAAQDGGKPPHFTASAGSPPDLVNRQDPEQLAGKNACKLLLRSTPSPAQVFVDGAFVGSRPLLLVLATGKYQIEMRGHRQDSVRSILDLLPRETRDVALSLTAPYPTYVTAQ
jgi:PEGA domain